MNVLLQNDIETAYYIIYYLLSLKSRNFQINLFSHISKWHQIITPECGWVCGMMWVHGGVYVCVEASQH